MVSKLNNRLVFIITGVLLVLSRVPFYQPHFYNWDATQLGLSLTGFDIAHHRPHPPGYIFYVLLGKLLNLLGFSPVLTFQLLATLMSGLGLWGLYVLIRRFTSKNWAYAGVMVALFHPYIWAYGVVGESYAAEFALSTWIGVLAVYTWQGNRNSFYLAAFLLGLAGGIRTSITIFLFPLLFFAGIKGGYGKKDWFSAAVLGVFGLLLWVVPSAVNTGGLARYMVLTHNLTTHVIAGTVSPVFGVDHAFAMQELYHLFAWLTVILWPLLLPSLFGGLVSLDTLETSPQHRPGLLGFTLLWVMPALIFYIVFFVSKPGYLLTFFAPVITLQIAACRNLASWIIRRYGYRSRRMAILGITGLGVVLGIQGFLSPSGVIKDWISISAAKIDATELVLQLGLSAIHKETRAHPKGSVAIVADLANPDWRRIMYYARDLPVYHLMYAANYPPLKNMVDACVACDRHADCASGPGFWTTWNLPDHLVVPLSKKVRYLVFMSTVENGLLLLMQGQRLETKGVGPFHYTVIDMKDSVRLLFDRFQFIRKNNLLWAKKVLSPCETDDVNSEVTKPGGTGKNMPVPD